MGIYYECPIWYVSDWDWEVLDFHYTSTRIIKSGRRKQGDWGWGQRSLHPRQLTAGAAGTRFSHPEMKRKIIFHPPAWLWVQNVSFLELVFLWFSRLIHKPSGSKSRDRWFGRCRYFRSCREAYISNDKRIAKTRDLTPNQLEKMPHKLMEQKAFQ